MLRPDPPPRRLAPRCVTVATLIGVIAACAALPPADGPLRPWQVAELERQAERLHRSPQTIDDPALMQWIDEALHRIDPVHGPKLRTFVLDRPAAQADLVGGRLLRVRTGLLRELREESEFVFVLAHELAHRRLGHVAAREAPAWDAVQAEIDADIEARQTLLALHLDPDIGRALLQRLASGLDRADDRATIQRRIDALATQEVSTPAVMLPYRLDEARFARLMARYR